ncbi:MAG: methionyl-tRNA formyltransferase [Burkholderiales bacterium]
MRLVFAGTPVFAAAALAALVRAGHDVVLVLTQPDRPAGRGMSPVPSEVKRLAERRRMALLQAATLADEQIRSRLRGCAAEAMVVAAYGLILPPAVLELFTYGCINIHASLLPRWRGAAPIQRALLAGDHETGISIMRMEKGLDTGPVFLMERVAIEADDTAGSLHDKLAALGALCIVRALDAIAYANLQPRPQPKDGATYARKIAKQEARIDWNKSAAELDRAVRAFNPTPGAFCTLAGEMVKVWRAQPVPASGGEPGEILTVARDAIIVRCGDGALRLLQLQRTGGRRLGAADFLRGHAVAAGQRLDG